MSTKQRAKGCVLGVSLYSSGVYWGRCCLSQKTVVDCLSLQVAGCLPNSFSSGGKVAGRLQLVSRCCVLVMAPPHFVGGGCPTEIDVEWSL